MSKTTKKLIVFSEIMVTAIESYAVEHELLYGGEPNFAAAVRELCGKGLRLDMVEAELKSGNPNFGKGEK